MLFDLRSPGRRRVIKVVYLFLAVLIGVGLVGFGVGTGGNFGGLFNAASSGGGSASGQVTYTKALKKAQKQAKAAPNAPASWVKVGQAALAVAQLPGNYDSTVGYSTTGHTALGTVKDAWNRYLALVPKSPNTIFAEEVASAFGEPPTGIGDYPTAESAEELVVETQPKSWTAYDALAVYAYLAKDVTAGEQAGAKAIALAPKSQLATLKETLQALQAQAGVTGATGATGASGAT